MWVTVLEVSFCILITKDACYQFPPVLMHLSAQKPARNSKVENVASGGISVLLNQWKTRETFTRGTYSKIISGCAYFQVYEIIGA